MELVCGFIAPATDCQPTEEEEWGECVSLEGASVDGERGGVSVDGHIVCVEGRVQLFACRDIGVLETVLLHKLEEDAVVHPSERTLEV